MAIAKSFRDLGAFQHSLDLVAIVYKATDQFPRREIYGLTSQMRRAS
ncbi:MAG: four helix bundle protein, partial [Thermoanaerobaculia bacterium]